MKLWCNMRDDRGWSDADSRVASVVVRRLVKASGRKGFGNAREVRVKLETSTARAMSRLDFDASELVLEVEDVRDGCSKCSQIRVPPLAALFRV